EALTLLPSGHPHHDTMLNNLAIALQTRCDKLHVSKDLNKAIAQYCNCLQLVQHDHPERHRVPCNLSLALCSHFMQTQVNGDVDEAIQLCQEALVSLPSLHPGRC
ncbi:hypothetical protein BDR05DRAFT_833880, partial [Suillus weaverae]